MTRLRVFVCAAAILCGTDTLVSAAASEATAQRGVSVPHTSELRLDRVRESLTGTHRHYQQFIDGIEVVGGERSETLLREGALRVNFDRTAHGVRTSSSAAIGRPAADFSNGETAAGRGRPAAADGDVRTPLVYVNVDGQARPARRVIVEQRRMEPHARYLDAVTGEVLRDEPLFYTAKGRVFDVNPVARLNDPSLRDANDSAAAVPAAAYSEVDLPGLAPSGPLTGPNVQIVDLEAPFTPRAEASQSLDFDRSQPQFEEVNAYFQIDRAQRYLQSLGYTGARQLVAYSIPVDAHAANGTDNSYYIEGSPPGRGTLYFGDGGTEDAEDSDIMLHEFGHAIHDWIIPGALTGPSSSQARAVSEGFGDYWSFSSTYAPTIASGRDPFCIADWDARCAGDDPSRQCGYPAGADCLRRVDSTKTIADYINSNDPGTEHKNGMIWSSALREIFMTLVRQLGADQGKRVADTIVLESLFGLPPSPDFRTVAQSMIAADRQLRNGSEADLICSAMTARGIFSTGDCGNAPRGEWTLFQSPDQQLPIPDGTGSITSSLTIGDTRAIAKIAVCVDIAHSSRGDLVISLVAPNGTMVKLKDSSQTDRTPDVHATFGIDAPTVDPLDTFDGQSAAGTWKLVVSDVYAGDVGMLVSWDLQIEFSGDAPATARPASAQSKVIPVAAHVSGVNGTLFTSDLYLQNHDAREMVAMVVFTPSGEDGTSSFSAMKVLVEPQQTVVLRDVVASLFHASGSGAIEVQTETSNLLVRSVIVNSHDDKTFSESIRAIDPVQTTTAGQAPLWVQPIVQSTQYRTNIGLNEIDGRAGDVRLTVYDSTGAVQAIVDRTVLPFSHVQFSSPAMITAPGPVFAEIRVISGDARVAGYGSLVDNGSGDSTVAAARSSRVAPLIYPVAGSVGDWRTEVWSSDPNVTGPIQPIDPSAFLTFYQPGAIHPPSTPLGFKSTSDFLSFLHISPPAVAQMELDSAAPLLVRVWHPCGSGTCGEGIDGIAAAAAASAGASAYAAGVINSASFRTNIGVSEVAGAPVDVRITLFDASGHALASTVRSVGPRSTVQFALTVMYGADVPLGTLRFEVVGGDGSILGYASVIDNRSGDPLFIAAE